MRTRYKDDSFYELANDIVRRAGHEDPESVDPMERFTLVLQHMMRRKPERQMPKEDAE